MFPSIIPQIMRFSTQWESSITYDRQRNIFWKTSAFPRFCTHLKLPSTMDTVLTKVVIPLCVLYMYIYIYI